MDRAEIDRLVQRLVDNPQDVEALEDARRTGEGDPTSYAMLIVSLLYRRIETLTPFCTQNSNVRSELVGLYEELGRTWLQKPLAQPNKAIDAFKKAIEFDPTNAYAIYHMREAYKQLGDWQNAIPLYAAELELEDNPRRRIGLLRDEAVTHKLAGDFRGASSALAMAREINPSDPVLQQEYVSSILHRIQAGEDVPAADRSDASELLLALAETYEGERGIAYAGAALDIDPGSERGMKLFAEHARSLSQQTELTTRYRAYLSANPWGATSAEIRAAADEAGIHVEVEPTSTSTTLKPSNAVASITADTGSKNYQTEKTQTLNSAERPLTPTRPAATREKIQDALDAAHTATRKGKKLEAYAKYMEVLESAPSHREALGWMDDYLRSKRDYAALRDMLLAAVNATDGLQDEQEFRIERLREVASLCESNLRDIQGAISAWRQLLLLDDADESARAALTRGLERSSRWDELANLLEQEAAIASDVDAKAQVERKLAVLHETKRKDLVAAGQAWGRIARLLPNDERATLTAARLFDKGERLDLAAAVLAESAETTVDPIAQSELLRHLAEIRERLGDVIGAGNAYARAADVLRSGKLWKEAERLYVSVESWEKAADAAHERGLLTGDPKQQASLVARAAEYLTKAGRGAEALERLEESTNLDPLNDDYANLLVARYEERAEIDKLVAFLTRRGDMLTDRTKRTSIRRQAATLATTRLADKELARELWLKLLLDGDDNEALEHLVSDAVERADFTEAVTLLRRLGQNTVDKTEKIRVALREAALLASSVGDIETAISRYEFILSDLDPICRPALHAIANLQETRGYRAEAAHALERDLELALDTEERGRIARHLAQLYDALADRERAIRALDLVRKANPEDLGALRRLCELCELTEEWGRVAELFAVRIEVEADEQEIAELTKKLATVLADKLDRGNDALGALTALADAGDACIRAAYIDLGDRLGLKDMVATKLKEWWFDARHSADRTTALRGAFERFSQVGRDADAITVAIELARDKSADEKLASELEALAVKTNHHDALSVAHEVLARETRGEARARELVRQAEACVRAGMPHPDAISHGEQGLPFVAPADAEPLLERLAALATEPTEIIHIYERQVTRCKSPPDRIMALTRAAQIAALYDRPELSCAFFELALSGSPSDETLSTLETRAAEGDDLAASDALRRELCHALASSGYGARDGGRTRAHFLRRAATIAKRDLGDIEQAFTWLEAALIAHVEPLTLDVLESFGRESGDPKRAEAAITRALGEVFDGPLVKELLVRRAKIRREQLDERTAAAADLKKIHDLLPTDQAVMDDLAGLLIELADYKSLVRIYEVQILRGKDMNARAEFARKVARIWEEQLTDPREAADAWRRVLRMRPGDAEATSGFERTKDGAEFLNKPEGDPKIVYGPPKLVSDHPVAPPQRPTIEEQTVRPLMNTGTQSGPVKPTTSCIPPVPDATSSSTPPTSGAHLVPSSVRVPHRSAPPPLPWKLAAHDTSAPPHTRTTDVLTTLATLDEKHGATESYAAMISSDAEIIDADDFAEIIDDGVVRNTIA